MEPMDIDKSFNSSNSRIEENSLVLEESISLPKNPICSILDKGKRDITKKRNMIKYNYKMAAELRAQKGQPFKEKYKWQICFITSLGIIFTLLLKNGYFGQCFIPQVDVQKLRLILDQNVHGQDQAMRELEVAFSENDNFQVTVLVGPTGTGKTLASNIIAAFFDKTDNVFRFTFEPHQDWTSVSDCVDALSKCSKNIIIVDNLNVETNDIPQILPILQWKSFTLNLKIHIILIYTGMDISNSKDTLIKILSSERPILHTVHFKQMNHNDLDECIKNALHVRGLINVKDFKEISANFDVRGFGCKSIYNKISLLL